MPDHLKLVHVTTVPLTLYTFLDGQVRYMRDRGFEVVGIASPGEMLERFAQREGIDVLAIEMRRGMSPRHDVIALLRMVRAFRTTRPHIVHAHTPKAALLGMLAAWMLRVPVRVYHMHGLRMETANGWRRLVLWTSEWLSCRLAHRVLCVSPSLRTAALQERVCRPDKIVVPAFGSVNGVDAVRRFHPTEVAATNRPDLLRRFGIPCDARVILFVGRVVREKGVSELIDAWNVLRDRHETWHLLVIGPFEAQDPIDRADEEMLLSDPRIHLTGYIDVVPEMYTAADICVLPTYREGLGNVLLEAGAMELAVVATRVTGCIDVVRHGSTGSLVPPRDAGELAAAIDEYMRDPVLRRRHGVAARQDILRRFAPTHVWDATYSEYVRALETAGIPAPMPALRPTPDCRGLTGSVDAQFIAPVPSTHP